MIVLDTHVLVWTAEGDKRIGSIAGAKIEETRQTDRIGIAAITPWEIAMLVEKGRLRFALDVGVWLDKVLAKQGVDLLPIEPAIAVDSVRLPGNFHVDPADRFIVATARFWRVPLVTADRKILDYARRGEVQTIDASR